MKNKHNYIRAAERIVEKYISGMSLSMYRSSHGKWMHKNTRGLKAVQAAGYITGMGYQK